MSPRADTQSLHISTFKKTLRYFCYCSTKFLSLSRCTDSSYFKTSLSYHTSPPFLPLSFSLRLSLSIFPSPLVFFPLPTINVAFKMPIDLFP